MAVPYFGLLLHRQRRRLPLRKKRRTKNFYDIDELSVDLHEAFLF
jgi:hypothetical protein